MVVASGSFSRGCLWGYAIYETNGQRVTSVTTEKLRIKTSSHRDQILVPEGTSAVDGAPTVSTPATPVGAMVGAKRDRVLLRAAVSG